MGNSIRGELARLVISGRREVGATVTKVHKSAPVFSLKQSEENSHAL